MRSDASDASITEFAQTAESPSIAELDPTDESSSILGSVVMSEAAPTGKSFRTTESASVDFAPNQELSSSIESPSISELAPTDHPASAVEPTSITDLAPTGEPVLTNIPASTIERASIADLSTPTDEPGSTNAPPLAIEPASIAELAPTDEPGSTSAPPLTIEPTPIAELAPTDEPTPANAPASTIEHAELELVSTCEYKSALQSVSTAMSTSLTETASTSYSDASVMAKARRLQRPAPGSKAVVKQIKPKFRTPSAQPKARVLARRLPSAVTEKVKDTTASSDMKTWKMRILPSPKNPTRKKSNEGDPKKAKHMFNCLYCERTFRHVGQLMWHCKIHASNQAPVSSAFKNPEKLKTAPARRAPSASSSKESNARQAPPAKGTGRTSAHAKAHARQERPVSSTAVGKDRPPKGVARRTAESNRRPSTVKVTDSSKARVALKTTESDHLHDGRPAATKKEEKFECPVSNATFQTSSNLVKHKSTHSLSGKPFTCAECKTRYSTSTNLKRHLLCHIHNKSYKCMRCSASLPSVSELLQHRLSHQTAGKGKIKCLQCNAVYSTSSGLQKHLKVHDINDNLPGKTARSQLKETSVTRDGQGSHDDPGNKAVQSKSTVPKATAFAQSIKVGSSQKLDVRTDLNSVDDGNGIPCVARQSRRLQLAQQTSETIQAEEDVTAAPSKCARRMRSFLSL